MVERIFEKVCVLGLGYIGLPTSLVLTGRGYKVVGVDVNENVVNMLNEGKVHISEPDLCALMKSALKRKKFIAKNKVEPADIFFICVPTPVNDEQGPDLKHVFEATEAIAPYLRKGNLVILESTCPVNTSKKVAKILEERTGLARGKEFYLAYCPERVLPGYILKEIIENDKVIGGINKESAQKAKKLYSSFVRGKICLTDDVTAEMAKLVENAYRDINIAFANQLSIMCNELNIPVWNLIKIANRHPRVNIHKPGPGVGGHCIAVDPWFLVDSFGEKASLVRLARQINNYKAKYVFDKISEKISELGKAVRVACFGATYKPNVDDIRNSPALNIINDLKNVGTDVIVCDSYIREEDAKKNNLLLFRNPKEAIDAADLLVFLVSHDNFDDYLDYIRNNKTVLDFCGIYENRK